MVISSLCFQIDRNVRLELEADDVQERKVMYIRINISHNVSCVEKVSRLKRASIHGVNISVRKRAPELFRPFQAWGTPALFSGR